MKVHSLLSEEVRAQSFVGVEQDSVHVVVELGGHILAQELHLVDAVATLASSLAGSGLLGAFVVALDHFRGTAWLDFGDVEAGAEGVGSVVLVEEVVERSGREASMLLVHLSEDNWGHAHFALECGLLGVLVVSDLGDLRGKLGGGDEGHDVGVVLQDEDSLGGGVVVGAGPNSHNGALSDVWELDFKRQGVEDLAGRVLQLKLVGVLVQLEDLKNLGDDVEVLLLFGSLLQLRGLSVRDDLARGEVLVRPLLQSACDGRILSLLGGPLARVSVWSIANSLTERRELVGGVKGPRALEEHVNVELSLALVDSQVGSVDPDDVTDSVNDGEVFEPVGVDDDLSPVLLVLGVERGINDLE